MGVGEKVGSSFGVRHTHSAGRNEEHNASAPGDHHAVKEVELPTAPSFAGDVDDQSKHVTDVGAGVASPFKPDQ